MSATRSASSRIPRAPPLRPLPLSPWAWGAVAATATFVAITCWWLSRDLSTPSGDPGAHLLWANHVRDLLASGSFGEIVTVPQMYPPATYVVGGLAALVGGIGVRAPILGENLVYVPLLALGCYQTGRLAQDARAGFLAVVFALGTPLVIEQFHVFMLDAPQLAIVAVSVWLILASSRFSRVGVALLAGAAVGLGVLTKQTFPLYVVGLLAVVLARGGWRNWRGLVAFAGAALVVGAPWYAVNHSMLSLWTHEGWGGVQHIGVLGVPPQETPPLVSFANLTWYGWATLNGVLFAPLTAFAAVGVVRSVQAARRQREVVLNGFFPELVGGLAGGWLAITLMPHHDLRYGMPLLVFLAVLGTAWIGPLGRRARVVAMALLACAVAATTLGVGFGVGHEVRLRLTGHTPAFVRHRGLPPRDEVTLYADSAFRVSGPRREDDVLGFFKRLRREGVVHVSWTYADAPFDDRAFDLQGLSLFADMSAREFGRDPAWPGPNERNAVLVHRPLSAPDRPSPEPPCLQLSDGTGVWVVLSSGEAFCPAPSRR